jgi:hypothetical protein
MSSSCIAPDRPVTVRKAQGEDVAGLYNLLVTTSYRHMICLTVFPDDLTKAGKGGEGGAPARTPPPLPSLPPSIYPAGKTVGVSGGIG